VVGLNEPGGAALLRRSIQRRTTRGPRRSGASDARLAPAMSQPDEPWYEDLFDDRYLEFYAGWVQVAPADAEAAFIDRALALEPGSRVLDLGCGFGRHAVALARLGHRVTGLDLSEPLLTHARALARQHELEISWLRRDMRDLGGLGPFDACVCLYTVLGYFDDDENARVVRGIRDLLEPDGRLLLDVSNPLSRLRSWPSERWRETPAGVARETSRYEALTGRVTSERTLFRKDGTRMDLPDSVVRMYTPSEVARLLADAALEVEQVYGALADEPFAWERCDKQVWVASKAVE